MTEQNSKGPYRVKFIADLLGEGVSQAEIGRRLGISRARVGQIVKANGLHRPTMLVQGPLNASQVRILTCIREFSSRKSYPPSHREIARACGTSTSVVADSLRTLEGKRIPHPDARHRTKYRPDRSWQGGEHFIGNSPKTRCFHLMWVGSCSGTVEDGAKGCLQRESILTFPSSMDVERFTRCIRAAGASAPTVRPWSIFVLQ